MKEDRTAQAPEVPVELFKILGHDVRNALTSIQLLTQIALRQQEKQTAEQLRSFLTKIDGQSAKLAGLVNELLDVARIQAGRMSFQKQHVDVAGFLGEVSRKAAAAITGPEINWGEPPAAQAELDQARIQQAVTCILSHGARHIRGVTAIGVRSGIMNGNLNISMEFRHAEPGDEAEVFWELNGTGADDPLPDPKLFIAAEIIRLHGGTIRSETAEDTLTTVHLTLPVSS
ncbi:MAG TPA: HAMP domain-containing sensor histidine kinase [Sphingobacteriaceae bacterium]